MRVWDLCKITSKSGLNYCKIGLKSMLLEMIKYSFSTPLLMFSGFYTAKRLASYFL